MDMRDLLRRSGAIISDSHFVLTSGRHSNAYINMRVLAGHTIELLSIGRALAEVIGCHENKTYLDACRVVIVGPETLGRTLADFSVSDLFSSYGKGGRFFAWCEMKKADDGCEWAEWNPKLDFSEIIKGARVYIVDDLLTTGKSIKLVVQLVEKTGGTVSGVAVAVRRDPEVTAETIGVPWLSALFDVTLETYDAESCPLCGKKIPMRLRPGHGHEWIGDHPGYPYHSE